MLSAFAELSHAMRSFLFAVAVLPCLLLLAVSARDELYDENYWEPPDVARDFFDKHAGTGGSGHTNNWAVLVSASRYWFNYRVCNSILKL